MNLVILTGAGISAESGLATFRDPGALWERYDPMQLATPAAFASMPKTVHAFYNARRRALLAAAPNPAHLALVRLQARLAARGDSLLLVTQNVDDLHERAGSEPVHMHGELLRARCLACGAAMPWCDDLDTATPCPECAATGRLRPDVVWFGEMPLHMDRIEAALARADLFVAIGTSGAVYPAAGFVAWARAARARTCELNLAPSDNAHAFAERRYGPASAIVPDWVDAVLAGPAAPPPHNQ